MKPITVVIVLASLVVATCAGLLCSALQGSGMPGEGIFSFLFGMIAIVAGGSGTMIPMAWAADRFGAARRRKEPCL